MRSSRVSLCSRLPGAFSPPASPRRFLPAASALLALAAGTVASALLVACADADADPAGAALYDAAGMG